MEEACASKTLEQAYYPTHRNNPENYDLKNHAVEEFHIRYKASFCLAETSKR